MNVAMSRLAIELTNLLTKNYSKMIVKETSVPYTYSYLQLVKMKANDDMSPDNPPRGIYFFELVRILFYEKYV